MIAGIDMRLLVDYIPTKPQDCMFLKPIPYVDEETMENAEICEDCGGLDIDEDDIHYIPLCVVTGGICALIRNNECDCLSTGYVTRF